MKTFKTIIAVLFLVSMVTPSSYAVDRKSDENSPSQASLSDNISINDNQTIDKESEPVNLFKISGIKSDRSFMIDGEEEGSKFIESGSDVILRSFITIKDIPQSIVNDITIDFSTQKNITSFDMKFPANINDALLVGSAFLTNLIMHEFGHSIVADQVGASGNRVNFFKEKNGSFFLGTSTVSHIEPKSTLPYVMGGEFFVDLTFEQALKDYRKSPSVYNKSLLLISGTDFLIYTMYVLATDNKNASYDPVTISQETGLSMEELFSVLMAKSMINAYRVYSGEDKVVPYFTVSTHSAALNLGIPF